MSQQPTHGGCKFLDLESQINAFATRWLQRLIDPTPSPWKKKKNQITMVIDDKATAMAGTAAHSLSEGDLMEDGEGDDWRGLDQENGAKIRRREA